MSPAVRDHAISEARIAFVRYCDENAGSGKTAAEISCDFYLLGYQGALTPRSIAAIEADAVGMLTAEYGANYAHQ